MIEFKISNPDLRWENTTIFARVNAWRWSDNRDERTAFANEVARFFSDVFGREIRWNYEGSLQGHYVRK